MLNGIYSKFDDVINRNQAYKVCNVCWCYRALQPCFNKLELLVSYRKCGKLHGYAKIATRRCIRISIYLRPIHLQLAFMSNITKTGKDRSTY